MSEVSTDMRSLRSKSVGPLTELEIPVEKKENQSRKVRHRAGHGYEDVSIASIGKKCNNVKKSDCDSQSVTQSQLTKGVCGEPMWKIVVVNQNVRQ